jgi:hypothetical protein
VKENPVSLCTPGETLKVAIPSDLEKRQFHIYLYRVTISILKKIDQLP